MPAVVYRRRLLAHRPADRVAASPKPPARDPFGKLLPLANPMLIRENSWRKGQPNAGELCPPAEDGPFNATPDRSQVDRLLNAILI